MRVRVRVRVGVRVGVRVRVRARVRARIRVKVRIRVRVRVRQLLSTMSAAQAAASTGLSRKSLSWRAVYSCSLARHSGARSESEWCAVKQPITSPPRAGTPGEGEGEG